MSDAHAYSGERLSFFKLFSQKQFMVEIPIIQRDYAQGRNSVREVRDGFLDALYEYLDEDKANRDLDFVYGSVYQTGERRHFVPLDGQQRLTTLFLLHWYLAQISGNTASYRKVLTSKQISLFSYETRSSSREFCDSLMACDIDISVLMNDGASISRTIKDKGWFYLSWENDPTIQSMIVMLDSIHTKFSKRPEFYEKLIDEESPAITFLFLDLQKFKLTDDLYIKMNARGKPLTGFENFKAKLEQHVKSFYGEWPKYKLAHSGGNVNGHQYFIHKIDTDWADIFWAYRNQDDESGVFDDELMNFIAFIIANCALLYERENVSVDDLIEQRGRIKRLSFHEYIQLGCLSQKEVTRLILMLDLLYNGGLKDGRLNTYTGDNYYYSEVEQFQKVISNTASYPEKLRFHAFYTYLASGKPVENMLDWMRVVFNLTENTIINTSDEYERALISIDQLAHADGQILDELADDVDISFFSTWQVLEEKIKACLLGKSSDWEKIIVKTEQHSFFKGQIGFILQFAGILEFYKDNGGCEWRESVDSKYFEAFSYYANSSAKLFSLNGRNSGAIDFLWERAVLSKGVYFTETSASRMNMLSTRQSKNNIERDHSWKRLLRILGRPDAYWDDRKQYVKAVFDDPFFNDEKIKESLQAICSKALDRDEIEKWRKAFIKYPALYRECNQGFIAKNHDGIFLFTESQRNHYHSELFSRVLELDLNSKRVAPFKWVDYIKVKTQDDLPSLKISGWSYDEDFYTIELWFESNEYHLLFYKYGYDDYPEELVSILNSKKLETTDEYYGISFLYKAEKMKGIIRKIYDLCSGLADLSNE